MLGLILVILMVCAAARAARGHVQAAGDQCVAMGRGPHPWRGRGSEGPLGPGRGLGAFDAVAPYGWHGIGPPAIRGDLAGLAAVAGRDDSARMEWRDEGALLSVRPHGESAAIIEVFTAAHGRHLGVVRGGGSRRMAGILQPGAQLALHWQARLDEHMGSFRAEPLHARAALLNDRGGLAALNAVCALLHLTLPERDPHPALYARTMALLDLLEQAGDWPAAYLVWELSLLDEIGYGLDLSSCAVTGSTQDLAYVSPRSGRAVSRTGAGEWAARLLPLPRILHLQDGTAAEAVEGLRLTGHFLARALAAADRALPEARARVIDRIGRYKTVAD